ncbi:hypothetical protein [Lacticaseibacillus yichunensis]|uniref:DUF4064 domain-containing protein n=1 Tax=Lacticaseibacillus yichunensis TaxID=2486015 RepID=A0ABW4CMC3_9LACO|nr:hypothetical protein [Lacticaseibacillus yichunensis]
MATKIKGADGKTYERVAPSSPKRKRTVEIILGAISLIVSLVSLASAMGLAAVGDAFGGGGSYTATLMIGMLLSIAAFVLIFFINKKHAIISTLILILGVVLLFSSGNFGIPGGIAFMITGIVAIIRK